MSFADLTVLRLAPLYFTRYSIERLPILLAALVERTYVSLTLSMLSH